MSQHPNSTPRVSVVVPAFNVARYISDAVESVRAQTLKQWELLIVDDGSTDQTGTIADSYVAGDARIRVVHQENGGLSNARNTGIRNVNPASPYSLFLDADDMLCPDALEMLVGILASEPDMVGVYGLPLAITTDGRPLTRRIEDAYGYRRRGLVRGRCVDWPAEDPTTVEVLAIWTCIQTAGQLLLRRRSMDGLWFDPGIVSEDWDYWFRLSLRGGFKQLNKFVMLKRENPTSITSTWKRTSRTAPIMRRKWLALPEATPAVRQLIKQGHRESVLLRFGWGWSSIRVGEVSGGIRHFATLVLEAVNYIAMLNEYRNAIRSRA
jgi:glycosyltransferase involved in cell wall biosynthesis